MEYIELLKSPKWQRKRLEIFDRDGFTCRFCGATDNQLHVHHLIYLKDKYPWEYGDEYLLTLCDICHQDEEKLKYEDKFLLGNILMAGIKRRDLYSLASSLRTYFDNSDKVNQFLKLNDFLNDG
jgi:hypothetical protein